MTKRLYYDDCMLMTFTATVTACVQDKDHFLIALDQSAFYPTSGGQPYDTGVLTMEDGFCVRVVDVNGDEHGDVWHTCDGALSVGACVLGCIDRDRRLDHMEQHGGEHMLAGAIWRHLKGVTIGLHTGREDATIDVTLPDGRTHMTREEIRLLEDDVNAHIRENARVKCFFPDAEELKALPLRKAPTVDDNVRVVQMGDFEYCACGGTHPPFTGMIGMVKILSVTPAKGKARVRFVCGKRAQTLLCDAYEAAKAAGEKMSCTIGEVPESVEGLKNRIADMEKAKNELSGKLAMHLVRDAMAHAVFLPNGMQVVKLMLPQGERKMLVDCASDIIKHANTVALCAMPSEKGGMQVVFACGAGVQADMGALMRAAHCRGGGKKDFAQGSAENADVLKCALAELQKQL